jgi:predicted Rossmann fold flavoprotein
MNHKNVAVIGGGAAGIFGALACAQSHPEWRITVFEKTAQLLSKVRISGGGRCNVTHHCFDPVQLVCNYPRGGKELRGAFTRFQPRDTINWFESRGVPLKAEDDGRMFPYTDSSETIISCLLNEAAKLGVEIRLKSAVVECTKTDKEFSLTLSQGENIFCDHILAATGGASRTNPWLEKLGHHLSPPVPSLFTFNIPKNSFLPELAGIALARVHLVLEESGLKEGSLEQTGPLLITHWGLSGPAVLKLSAWAARYLHACHYCATVKVNWLPALNINESQQKISQWRQEHGNRLIYVQMPFELPKNLWKALVKAAGIPPELRWAMLSKKQAQDLLQGVHASRFQIEGKTTHKEEFVTCGGVKLEEVNFKTMESRICPGLYFAGEILDIDGITGGFNFQSAWTTAWIAGTSMV